MMKKRSTFDDLKYNSNNFNIYVYDVEQPWMCVGLYTVMPFFIINVFNAIFDTH